MDNEVSHVPGGKDGAAPACDASPNARANASCTAVKLSREREVHLSPEKVSRAFPLFSTVFCPR